MEHLVYTDAKSKVLEKLLSGEKTLIVRGAAGRKLPHSRVNEGERLYFTQNNGKMLIEATAVVKSAFHSEKMTPEESEALLKEKQDQLQLSDAQKKRWYGKKFLCLVEVEQVNPVAPEFFYREKNMDDWLIAEDIKQLTDPEKAKEYRNLRLEK